MGLARPPRRRDVLLLRGPGPVPADRLALANTYRDLPIDKVRLLVGSQRPQRLSQARPGGTQQGRPAVGVTVKEISVIPDLSKYPYVNKDLAGFGAPSSLELDRQGGIADGSQPGRGGGVLSMCGQVPPPPSGGSI